MKNLMLIFALAFAIVALNSCGTEEKKEEMTLNPELQKKIDAYAPVEITADVTNLSESQKKVLMLLADAGNIADEIFWVQTAPDAAKIRDSLRAANTPEALQYLDYVLINYGPYDVIYGNKRFVGDGPEERPAGGNFYPEDMTKVEFEAFVKEHPDKKDEFESQYTVIRRAGDELVAIPYHEAYAKVEQLCEKLDAAAEVCENESLKKYLQLRADAIRRDDYLASDLAWMELEGNDIDVVIGPIENYEDGLYNYKTAYECIVMVKDPDATAELELFKKNIADFEKNLPYSNKNYIRKNIATGDILQIVNVTYFGGDCQKGTKTIASSLPNDPRVHKAKGGKKSMFKNMMEAKFNKIVVPIAGVLLDENLVPHISGRAFTSFVTLHEIAHTLGRGYVYGNDDMSVRRALKERYSAIEETKADIVSMHTHKVMLDMGLYDEAYIKKAMSTYLAGLFRSIRFGTERAHGKANLIQLNYLMKNGAIFKNEKGKYSINEEIFFDKVADLANLVLTLEAEGDYEKAGQVFDDYAQESEELKADIQKLSDIPRDLNTTYAPKYN
ncbi:MAG: peptidase [Candidatus Kapaibacterium sp.]